MRMPPAIMASTQTRFHAGRLRPAADLARRCGQLSDILADSDEVPALIGGACSLGDRYKGLLSVRSW